MLAPLPNGHKSRSGHGPSWQGAACRYDRPLSTTEGVDDGTDGRQGRADHRRGTGSGAFARGAAGRGGRGDHRRRHLRGSRDGAVRAADARRPRRDGAAGRGPRPADRRPAGRRARPARRSTRSCRRGSPSSATSTSSARTRASGRSAPALEIDEETWDETIAINLTGVWKTIKAAMGPMIERGQGGSIIITSSAAGLKGFPNLVHYCRGEARRGRHHAHAGAGAGAVHDPCQLGAPHDRGHADDPIGRLPPHGAAGPREPDRRGHGRGLHRPELPADPVGRVGRHQQRRAVAGVGRGPLRHRRRRSPWTPASARRSAGRRWCCRRSGPQPRRRPRRAARRPRRPHRRPPPRGRPRAGGRDGRARPAAGRTAGHVEEHDPAGDHGDLGDPAAVRRGQRRAHPGAPRRPPQPGPRAARGLQRRELRAGTARRGDAARRLPVHRGAQPGSGGHAQRAAHGDGGALDRGATGRHDPRPRRSSASSPR